MSDTVIRVENLGKLYRIGLKEKAPSTLLNTVTGLVGAPFKYLRSVLREPAPEEVIWALKDVSFEVKQGEVVGIIGRNGAGKSTLLKILSQITEPSCGYAEIRGQVSSLLEVGTGFHPDLTGRENTYLNGTIMGMKKREIARRFDEIVAFAEVEKFIDTPVKFYSSGMYTRLAFAVAAHLEPEILILDEVLAVGDIQFQKKCLGKMGDVATKEGRTVLFVSHNMTSVRSLCQNAIIFESGTIAMEGRVETVMDKYFKDSTRKMMNHTATFQKPASALLWIESATVICGGVPETQMYMGETLLVKIKFHSEIPIQNPKIGLVISSVQGEAILNANNRYQLSESITVPVFDGVISCQLGTIPLMEGQYFISLWLGDQTNDYHYLDQALSFEVIERDIWGNSQAPPRKLSFLWWPTKFEVSSFTAVK